MIGSEEVKMEEQHKEFEKLVDEALGLRTRRRPAAEIMVVPQRSSGGTRQEGTRSGGRRWVTSLRPRLDLRRFTRGFPVL